MVEKMKLKSMDKIIEEHFQRLDNENVGCEENESLGDGLRYHSSTMVHEAISMGRLFWALTLWVK